MVQESHMIKCIWKLRMIAVIAAVLCHQTAAFQIAGKSLQPRALVKAWTVQSTFRNEQLITGNKHRSASYLFTKPMMQVQAPDPHFQRNPFKKLFQFVLIAVRGFMQRVLSVFRADTSRSSESATVSNDTVRSSAFLTIPSTPIHKISNLNVGRQYAESKLQEIEAYFSQGQRKYTAPFDAVSRNTMNKPKRCITDLLVSDLADKRVFVRCDLDVQLKNGKITDDTRMQSSLATIKYLSNKGAKVILASHLGSPNGTGYEPKYSMEPVAARLSTLLNQTVSLVPDCIGISVGRAVSEMHSGDVVLLENLRFYAEEENNDTDFANNLAAHVDVYVNDALSTTSQAHSVASTVGIIAPIKTDQKPVVSGLQLQKEIQYLQTAVATPERPFAAIVGGPKLSTQVDLIDAMLSHKVDKLVLSGGMVFTFLKAQGSNVGASTVEESMLDAARRLLQKAADNKVQLFLPSDFVVAEKLATNATHKVASGNEIPTGWMGLDIGPKTVAEFQSALVDCKTVVWSGTPGVCEIDAFAHGTTAIAATLTELTQKGGVTIVVGEDTVAAVAKAGLTANMTHVSTGGASAVQLLQGSPMSGIAALDDK